MSGTTNPDRPAQKPSDEGAERDVPSRGLSGAGLGESSVVSQGTLGVPSDDGAFTTILVHMVQVTQDHMPDSRS
ncbi:MAG: hypothetical protein Q4C81_10160 [Kocuria sp.]|nr:hypothetical protein [Kocuria sp.]